MKTTTEMLAAAFARGLRNNLDAATLAAIDAENAARADDSCASHDHLDANETMAEAFMAVMGRAPKASSSADAELINAAWDAAKAAGYAPRGGTPMKKVQQLRDQLAALIAAPGPVGQRGRAMWPVAEEISARTGEPVRRVFERGAHDAAAILAAEVRR